MWQRSGSHEQIWFGVKQQGPSDYVKDLNQQKAAGFSDWRLPTVEKFGSLLELIGISEGKFIHTLFDPGQWECVTSDRLIKQGKFVGPWEVFVDFGSGRIRHSRFRTGLTHKAFVRAVRTMVREE